MSEESVVILSTGVIMGDFFTDTDDEEILNHVLRNADTEDHLHSDKTDFDPVSDLDEFLKALHANSTEEQNNNEEIIKDEEESHSVEECCEDVLEDFDINIIDRKDNVDIITSKSWSQSDIEIDKEITENIRSVGKGEEDIDVAEVDITTSKDVAGEINKEKERSINIEEETVLGQNCEKDEDLDIHIETIHDINLELSSDTDTQTSGYSHTDTGVDVDIETIQEIQMVTHRAEIKMTEYENRERDESVDVGTSEEVQDRERDQSEYKSDSVLTDTNKVEFEKVKENVANDSKISEEFGLDIKESGCKTNFPVDTETNEDEFEEETKNDAKMKNMSDSLNKVHIKQYLSKGKKNKTLIEIYEESMENGDTKNKLLESMRSHYLTGRIPMREYFEAIHLQIGELDDGDGPLANNPQVQMIDSVHFDEVKDFIENDKDMPRMSSYEDEFVLQFLSLYCNTLDAD